MKDHMVAADMSPPVGFWWKVLAEAYERDSKASSMDQDTLLSLGTPRIPNPKQTDTIVGILQGLRTPVSPLNTVQVALELKRKNLTAEFASASMGGDRKKADKLLKSLNEIWEADNFEQREQAEWRDAESVIGLFERVGSGQRIPFGPKSLAAKLDGGVLPGTHIVIFGRTEIGKSTFVIDSVGRLLKRGKRVLYIGNEDEINKLKLRLVCRVLKITAEEAEADVPGTAEKFAEYEPNLLMTQLYNGTVESIRERVIEFKPDILVVDQFRNLAGDDEGMTRNMEQNAIKLRALLLEFRMVGISVTQANDRSEKHGQEPPIWLSSSDVDSSRVGLPGQADLLIGIGANSELKSRGQRFISICKNKCSSAPGSHEGFIVEYDLARSTVR